eukprot:1159899-Pelagomonas_calceolata.AAC.8
MILERENLILLTCRSESIFKWVGARVHAQTQHLLTRLFRVACSRSWGESGRHGIRHHNTIQLILGTSSAGTVAIYCAPNLVLSK